MAPVGQACWQGAARQCLQWSLIISQRPGVRGQGSGVRDEEGESTAVAAKATGVKKAVAKELGIEVKDDGPDVRVRRPRGRDQLAAMKTSVGEREIAGQTAHAHTDVNDDHPGEVWSAIRFLIRDKDDVAHLKRYIAEHQRVLAMYFHEIHADIVEPCAEREPALNAVAV